MSSTTALYEEYREKMQRIADVRFANAVLQWDQETYLPAKGATLRGQQISTLSQISHDLFADEALGNLLNELLERGDLDEMQRRNVELTLEDYVKNKKYSSAFVRQMAEQVAKTFYAWIEARKQNSFVPYEKELAALIELKKEETHILGFEEHPYNALLHEFEKGCTVSLLDRVFSALFPPLQELLKQIRNKPQVDDSFLHQAFPKDQQWAWGLQLIKALNFDFEAGRQDVSEHPFSVSFNPGDVRITTRIDEHSFSNMTWSCIHETGHGLYEQGLPPTQYGLPLGEACSYSIHESQSRLWENNIGRSLPFWEHFYPQLQSFFPAQFKHTDTVAFYKGINKVSSSLIRTEADELTYHFHVYIRYELEKALFSNNLKAKEIPAWWNEQYKNLLGLVVPDDKQGCLQDVHWSHGSFGYFPTYSLGSFYAAQFMAAARQNGAVGDEKLSAGDTYELLQWLRQNIHSKGRLLTSEALCKTITGETLNITHFITYLSKKFSFVYSL
jgi:carboxypeptidase Taq